MPFRSPTFRSGPWRLPGYRVETLLGAGASGEVWRGQVRSTGAAVALKRIAVRDEQQYADAVAEATLLSALDHPNLIRLHDLVRVDGAIVLVLDLAEGGSLADLLAVRGRMAPGEVITALTPIAAALAHAHAAGVVHGDVTPANVLFSPIGLPLLADLGVARLVGQVIPVRTTMAYADPSVSGGGIPTPSSDVYMLGAVALHALTGEPPWPGMLVRHDRPAAGLDVRRRLDAAGVPEVMSRVVCRALDEAPEFRGTSAGFALELRHSGWPVAVELGAGRERTAPSAGRLATLAVARPTGAPIGTETSTAPVRAKHEVASIAPVAAAVPVWSARDMPVAGGMADGVAMHDAPVAAAADPGHGAPPLTRGVRLPSPMPPGGARHRAGRRSLLAPVAIVVVAAVLVAVGLLYWPRSPASPTAGRPPQRTSPATARPSRAAVLDADAARRVLVRLDELRARAFAMRSPGLLADVYSSAALLSRDRAMLAAAVPDGCGLRGARTSYRRLRLIRRDRSRVWVSVAASLPATTVVCAGHRAGHAPATGPTTLDVELVAARGAEYRIAAQRVQR